MAGFAIPLAVSGISALAGGLLNKNKKQQQTTRSNNSSDVSSDTWNIPQYDSYGEEMRQKLLNSYMGSLDEDPDLSGYQAQGQSNINQMNDVRTMALRNSLSSRGLSYSPIAPLAQQQNDNARIGEQASFLNTIPLLQRKMRDERLAAAGGFFKGLPVGSRNLSSGAQHQSQEGFSEGTQPGNPAGGALAGLGTSLAGLYGYGAFDGAFKKKPSYDPAVTGYS